MQITNIRQEVVDARARVTADVSWEDSDRKPFAVFVETEARYAHALSPDPNAFLLMAVVPAWHRRERRLRVAGNLCPVLKHDILAALRALSGWYPEMGAWPALESDSEAIRSPRDGGALSFLSCGVDSLATLRQNTLLIPSSHPLAIRAVLPVVEHATPGQAIGAESARLAPASRIANDSGVDLVPVWTNAWRIVSNGYLWDEKSHGALFSGIASCLGASFSLAYIAASFDGALSARPWGSSPLLDPFYSSAHFRIHHHGGGMSRFEKTALIAEWPVGLQNLRVCQRDDTGTANCGRCEKCLRTMTTLEALGKLEGLTDTFPSQTITPEELGMLVKYNMITHKHQLTWYRETVDALTSRGRTDLATMINQVCAHFEKHLSH